MIQADFKKLLNSETGKIVISALLGLGLATLFNKVCKDKNCIIFNGPILSEIDGKIYKYGDKCYKYKMNPSQCESTKRIIEISNKDTIV
uniref:Uncharacterized protein n=1 Tax=viral metagenome TaxID=1070528 RepID=A0A6C0HUX1_9ZZZZ